MVLNPVCLVQDGINPYVGTTTGVDVTPGATISIKLATPVGPTAWFLEILGADELTTPLPTLTGVNILTHQVASPSTVVTLTFPNAVGRAIGFRSTVTGTGGPISTSFGVYSLTTFATRVGFVTETREGDPTYGWASKLNPLIRSGGVNPNNYSLIDVPDNQTIPAGQQMLFVGDIVVDGQLIVEGQIVDATPYDGNDILAALTEIAPNTPSILGVNSPVGFLTPAQARTVMDVPSIAEMNAAIGTSGLAQDPIVHHSSFNAITNTTHYVWTLDGSNKVITLPGSPTDGDRIEIIGLGNGDDQLEVNNTVADVYYNGDVISYAGDPFLLPGGGVHLLIVFRSAAATGGSNAWFNITDGVSTQFAASGGAAQRAIITSDGASGVPGKVGALDLGPNSLVGRSASNQIDAIPVNDGELLFRPQGGQIQSISPSGLNPWSSNISGAGTHVLEINKVNKYLSGPGMILQLPTANHGDELEVKESSASAGTAPNIVTLTTNSGFINVENIGIGGNTQTDNLTEYKTWVKYKFDSSQSVWRIVGAAYQLP